MPVPQGIEAFPSRKTMRELMREIQAYLAFVELARKEN